MAVSTVGPASLAALARRFSKYVNRQAVPYVTVLLCRVAFWGGGSIREKMYSSGFHAMSSYDLGRGPRRGWRGTVRASELADSPKPVPKLGRHRSSCRRRGEHSTYTRPHKATFQVYSYYDAGPVDPRGD